MKGESIMATIDEKRLAELLEKEKVYNRTKETAERARLRREAKIKIILRKAHEKGIVATEAEIDAEMKK